MVSGWALLVKEKEGEGAPRFFALKVRRAGSKPPGGSGRNDRLIPTSVASRCQIREFAQYSNQLTMYWRAQRAPFRNETIYVELITSFHKYKDIYFIITNDIYRSERPFQAVAAHELQKPHAFPSSY